MIEKVQIDCPECGAKCEVSEHLVESPIYGFCQRCQNWRAARHSGLRPGWMNLAYQLLGEFEARGWEFSVIEIKPKWEWLDFAIGFSLEGAEKDEAYDLMRQYRDRSMEVCMECGLSYDNHYGACTRHPGR